MFIPWHGLKGQWLKVMYVLDKTLGFVTNYLHEFEHVLKRVWDGKEDRVFGKVLKGVCTKFVFSPIL